MTEATQLSPTRYVYKPSVAGSPQSFELTPEGLSFQTGFRSGLWRYGDIARIRMTYRPVSMLQHRFRTDIRHKDGRALTIISATWSGMIALTPQNEGYRVFVEALHQHVAAEQGSVECVGGMHRLAFVLGVATLAAIMLAIAVLFVRALLAGDWIAALFLLGFALWCGWYLGSWMKRNKPQRYKPTHVPRELLP